jgi:hypothetical protein
MRLGAPDSCSEDGDDYGTCVVFPGYFDNDTGVCIKSL